LAKLTPGASVAGDWEAEFFTIMNSNPVIDEGLGQAVWASAWQFDIGTRRAAIVAYKFNLTNGQVVNNLPGLGPPILLEQQYPLDATSQPLIPYGVFSTSGDNFTMPIFTYNTNNEPSATIISCATAGGNCEQGARRWTTRTFTGIIRQLVPYSNGNIIAAIGPYQVYFLDSRLGTVLNAGELPITPSGTQYVLGVQPGLASDFYVLTGPNRGSQTSFPTEIIAVEEPGTGELWRVNYGSGESTTSGLTLGVDDARNVHLRVGNDLVQPLTNAQYRSLRAP
jgi:hypothetical protein